MIVTVMCKCGAEFDVEVTQEGGDWVPMPFGPGMCQTPSYPVAEIVEQRCFCPRSEGFDRGIEDTAIMYAEGRQDPDDGECDGEEEHYRHFGR